MSEWATIRVKATDAHGFEMVSVSAVPAAWLEEDPERLGRVLQAEVDAAWRYYASWRFALVC